jgi:uncharacterized protein YndB with AHSA1/START domain
MTLAIKEAAMPAAELSVVHSTFTIRRHYPVKAERVFAAFADPAKKQKWFGESEGRAVESFDSDFRVGGADRICYRMKEGTPFPGAIITNRTTYQDILPGRRIVMAYTMAFGDQPFSASLATIEIAAAGDGTDLVFTEQGAYFENSDGPERRQHGWNQLLDKLADALA